MERRAEELQRDDYTCGQKEGGNSVEGKEEGDLITLITNKGSRTCRARPAGTV